MLKTTDTTGFIPIKELAELLNCSTRTIYNKINHKTEFTINEVIKIADRLNISVDEAIKLLLNI